jgi:hypothetical protein
VPTASVTHQLHVLEGVNCTQKMQMRASVWEVSGVNGSELSPSSL